MLGQVERWLETFMCKQYADAFETCGFKTLQLVCQLQLPQLQAMGVPPEHCDLILENIHILRQTLTGQSQLYSEEMTGYYDNSGRGGQGQMSSSYPGNNQMVQMQGNMPRHHGGSGDGFNNPRAMHVPQQQTYPRQAYMQQQRLQLMNTPYRQAHGGGPTYPNQISGHGDLVPYTNAPGNSQVVNKQNPYQGQNPTLTSTSQSMQPPHPHSNRNMGQTPQEVADNIFHMASSSYMPQQTVQVPLSSNRSAPYHIPSRSPHYNTGQGQYQTLDYQQHVDPGQSMSGGGQGNRQFVYTGNTQHLQQNRNSPISPGPGVMQSPHSHHSFSSCSPSGALDSPGPGSVRSPLSDTGTPTMKSPTYMMQSQQQMTPSPGHTHQMRSPVPMNQQLHVSVPSSVSQSHYFFKDNPSPAHSHHSNQFSPDGQFSNISSPYTPGSRASIHSPNQIVTHSTLHATPVTDTSPSAGVAAGVGGSNSSPSPLRSLQRLCMLPESRVVDPKSVITDSCATTTSINCDQNSDKNTITNKSGRNCESPSSSHVQYSDGRNCEPQSSSHVQCSDGRNCEPPSSSHVQCSDGRNCEPPSSSHVQCSDGRNCEPPSSSHVQCSDGRNCEPPSSSHVQCSDGRNCSPKPEHNADDNVKENVHPFGDTSQQAESATETNVIAVTSNINVTVKLECNPSVTTDDLVIETLKVERNKMCHDGNSEYVSKENSADTVYDVNECTSKKVVPAGSVDKKCQPKKLMLLRAAKEVSEENAQDNCVVSNNMLKGTEDLPLGNTNNCDINKDQSVDSSEIENNSCTEVTTGDTGLHSDGANSVNTAGGFSPSVDKEFVPGTSDTDNESDVAVTKDMTNIYSKNEISSRIRSQSTGSLSDGIDYSDMDYEDHIGCDDITNDLSDLSDNNYDAMTLDPICDFTMAVSNSLEEEIKEAAIATEINGKTKLSSPHWKKSKLNSIQIIEQNVKNEKGKVNGRKRTPHTFKNCKRKVVNAGTNGKKKFLAGVNKFNDEDSDDSEAGHADVHIGIDNDNGTMSIASRINNCRRRKAPLKFEDAEFIKGDFVVVDDVSEPKRKLKKKNADINHNSSVKCPVKIKGDPSSVPENGKLTNLQVGNPVVKQKKETQNSYVKSKLKTDPLPPDKHLNNSDTASVTGKKRKIDNYKTDCNIDTPESNFDSDVPNLDATKIETNSKNKGKASISLQSAKNEITKCETSKPSDCDKTPMENDQHNSASPNNDTIARDTKPVQSKSLHESIELGCNSNINGKLTHNVKSEIGSGAKIRENKGAKFPETCRNDGTVINDVTGEVDSDHGDEVVTIDLTHREEDMQENDNCDSNDMDSIVVVDTDTREELFRFTSNETSLSPRKQEQSKKNDKIVSGNKTKVKKKTKRNRKGYEDADSGFEFGTKGSSWQSTNLNKTEEMIKSKKKNMRDKCANFKGPMIRLEGSKTTPTKCIVMNQPVDESDTNKKGTKTSTQSVATTLQISHLPSDKSVLIPHSNAEDGTTWTCALCGKHSSYKFLGDLFGPYTVETLEEIGVSSSKTGRKRKSDEHSQQGTSSGSSRAAHRRGSSQAKEAEVLKEVWVHESCAVWADGVFLIGSKVYGLQEAAGVARQMLCTLCRENGAMIGCLHKGCEQKFHHSCAVDRDCFVDEENFSLLCPKHKLRKLKQQADGAMSGIS